MLSFILSLSSPFVSILCIPALLFLSAHALNTKPFNAPALPLAVRHPYFSIWSPQGNEQNPLDNTWSFVWDIDYEGSDDSLTSIAGWTGIVNVDGSGYAIMGYVYGDTGLPSANQSDFEWTATRTSAIYSVGGMQINASFISPIEADNLVNQSIPFSYVVLSATSTDGQAHNLSFYTDITGEFISGDRDKTVTWNAVDDDFVILSMTLQAEESFTESGTRCLDSTSIYGMKKMDSANVTWQIASSPTARNAGANGTLPDLADSNFRAIDDGYPVLGIAVDYGMVNSTSTPEPVVLALGVVRNPLVQYRLPSGSNQDRAPYYLTSNQYSSGSFVSLSKAFLLDYARAIETSGRFDALLSDEGKKYSSDYADLLALSTRQLMGAFDITTSKTDNGYDSDDMMVFMKNMGGLGSDASNQAGLSVNTVDVLYAAFPAFLYLNPELGGGLLKPLLEYQDSSAYTLPYAAMNIGSSYPNATGDGLNNSHQYGIEETANMIIMVLAYSQRSGNGALISKHYSLLRDWAKYLRSNTLYPKEQFSADYQTQSPLVWNNQTNLALKGILGIAAMAEIANLAGLESDWKTFNDTASSYLESWKAMTLTDASSFNFYYGDPGTNGLMYNLYADLLLQLNAIDDTIYETLTSYYSDEVGSQQYGLALDSENTSRSAAHWSMFLAAIIRNSATQNEIISQIHSYASAGMNNTVFCLMYDSDAATPASAINTGTNSPAVGAFFSFLALNTTIHSTITIPTEGSTIRAETSPATQKAKIAGAVIGGVVGAGIIALLLFLTRRKRQARRLEKENEQQLCKTRYSYPNPKHDFTGSATSSEGPGTQAGGQLVYPYTCHGPDDSASYTYSGCCETDMYDYLTSTFAPSTDLNLPHGDKILDRALANLAAGPSISPKMREQLEAIQRQRLQAMRRNGIGQNHRSSSYFRRVSSADINTSLGPSASRANANGPAPISPWGAVPCSNPTRRRRQIPRTSKAITSNNDVFALQPALNQHLRTEVRKLREELLQIKQESGPVIEVPPPVYTDNDSRLGGTSCADRPDP